MRDINSIVNAAPQSHESWQAAHSELADQYDVIFTELHETAAEVGRLRELLAEALPYVDNYVEVSTEAITLKGRIDAALGERKE